MRIQRPDFPFALLDHLSGVGELQRFERGDLLIREGDESTHFFVVLTGELVAFTENGGGRELVFNTMEAGDYFGQLSLDGRPRSASVRATTAAECLVVTGDVIKDLLRKRPEFMFDLIVKLIDLLRRNTRRLKSLVFNDVYDRIVVLIDEEKVIHFDQLCLPRTFTQTEIANRVGATREMVNHVIRDLVRGGYLERSPGQGMIIRRMPSARG